LVAWILFVFHDYLYYPYGASSTKFKNTMASNLIMWEAIKYGKKLGLKYFDMWGALGHDPDPKDPWFGFHRFKEGYGPIHTEFAGSFDLVINPFAYQFYKIADKVRWLYLRIKKSI
jgi:lipid II:glycine glycyltransferase (peptidoglycan interpeptide bridge formation enzyme)